MKGSTQRRLLSLLTSNKLSYTQRLESGRPYRSPNKEWCKQYIEHAVHMWSLLKVKDAPAYKNSIVSITLKTNMSLWTDNTDPKIKGYDAKVDSGEIDLSSCTPKPLTTCEPATIEVQNSRPSKTQYNPSDNDNNLKKHFLGFILF